jgi:hypothetical protein
MQFDYNDPIITKRRKGTSNDPFIDCNETHVVENGKVILTEIPDPFTRVIVTGANKQWYEIQSGIPKDNEYLVDYKNKIVTFNTVNNGLQLNFSYKGTGLTYVPTSMIYTKQNNGEIVETLKQLTDSTEQARDSANEASDNLVHKGEYDNTTQYKKRNIVTYQGSAYMAIADTQGNPPTDKNYWKKLTAFSWRGIYDSSVTYNTGDFVQDVDQRNLYLSLTNSNIGNPLTDTTKWKKLITIDDIVNAANQAIADANAATTNANNAANNANTQAMNAQNAAQLANDAATNANNATNNANTQAQYAQQQGDYAKTQGDYAKQAAENNIINWLTPVNTYTDIATTYPNPQIGDLVQTIDDSKIYRWDGTQWVFVQKYDANAITDVQNKLAIASRSPNEYEWTATAGQVTYTLPEGTSYDPTTKWLEVFVGGAPVPDSLIQKDSPTQFTLLVDPSDIPDGVKVIARWVETYVPATSGHASKHYENGVDPIDVTKLMNYKSAIDDRIGILNKKTGIYVSLTEFEHLIPNKNEPDPKLWNWSDALQAAIDAAGQGGMVKIPPGYYLITKTINTLQHTHITSEKSYFGSGTNYNYPETQLVFDLPTGVAFNLGTNSMISHIYVRNKAAGNTAIAFNATSSPQFFKVGVNNFYKGMKLTNGYYVTFDHVEWAYCTIGVEADGCYNLTLIRPAFRFCSTAVKGLTAIKPLTIHGGSIEGFKTGAIVVPSSSTISLYGVYFETRELNAGHIIDVIDDNSTLNIYGCQVYLNETTSFVNAAGKNNITLNANGNTFREGSATTPDTPTAYLLPASGDVNIHGDNWQSVNKGVYVGGTFNQGAVQNYNVTAPKGVTTFHKDYNFVGRSMALPKLTSPPSAPLLGAIYCADGVNWNPLNKTANLPYFVTYVGNGTYTNLNWQQQGKTTITGDGTTKQFSIPHNLGKAPSYCHASAGNANAGYNTIDYVYADSTNLYVVFKNPPANGTSNVVFWKVEL